jgi:hypothetical protein
MNKMITDTRPDTLHRGVKMALDNGEADSVEAAYALFDNRPGSRGWSVGRRPSRSADHGQLRPAGPVRRG